MADPSNNSKVHFNQGGTVLEVESSGKVLFDAGATLDASAATAVLGSVQAGLVVLSADGAVSQHAPETYVITKVGVCALTLAAPTAGTDDGVMLEFTSDTANAHTLTATGLLDTGSVSVNVATWAAQKGASLRLMAYNGRWKTMSQVGITFS